MITIELKFLAGRFHANPFGRHVNEGVPEWPPSPYRLLRALYDSWQRKFAHLPENSVAAVLCALAQAPPAFALPDATASHTRSYLSANSLDPSDKALIFDGFVSVSRSSSCFITWPEDLDDTERRTLSTLLSGLNYLGRSESWIAAQLLNGIVPQPKTCLPADLSDVEGSLVRVACAVPQAEYKGKSSWLKALTYSTRDLVHDKRSGPPAMRMIPYVLTNPIATYVPPKGETGLLNVNAVELSLAGKVLPLAVSTIEIADQIRLKLMGIHKKIMGNNDALVSDKFSGKVNGLARKDHGHLFVLPIANKRGRIDRVLLFSKEPFTSEELSAILRLESLWQSDGKPDVACVLTWRGSSNDVDFRQTATLVVSGTPFCTIRHWRKGRGTQDEFLCDEVRRECRNHGLPLPVEVKVIEKLNGQFAPIEFRRNRKNEPPHAGHAFQIQFPGPGVPAPFTLGYGCHFGLGRFDPETGVR